MSTVDIELGDLKGEFMWQGTVRSTHLVTRKRVEVEVNWAFSTVVNGVNPHHDHFVTKVGHPDGLRYKLETKGGQFKFLENDTAGLKEYVDRCEQWLPQTAPTDPPGGAPGVPGT